MATGRLSSESRLGNVCERLRRRRWQLLGGALLMWMFGDALAGGVLLSRLLPAPYLALVMLFRGEGAGLSCDVAGWRHRQTGRARCLRRSRSRASRITWAGRRGGRDQPGDRHLTSGRPSPAPWWMGRNRCHRHAPTERPAAPVPPGPLPGSDRSAGRLRQARGRASPTSTRAHTTAAATSPGSRLRRHGPKCGECGFAFPVRAGCKRRARLRRW